MALYGPTHAHINIRDGGNGADGTDVYMMSVNLGVSRCRRLALMTQRLLVGWLRSAGRGFGRMASRRAGCSAWSARSGHHRARSRSINEWRRLRMINGDLERPKNNKNRFHYSYSVESWRTGKTKKDKKTKNKRKTKEKCSGFFKNRTVWTSSLLAKRPLICEQMSLKARVK